MTDSLTNPLLITDCLYRARDFFGDKTVVQYRDGAVACRYSYRRYYERVLQLAGALVRLGVRPGDRVATLAWNHYRHLELYLAVPLAGAVLHTLNVRLAPHEVGYIVGHAGDRMVVADTALLELLATARAAQPDMLVVTTDGAERCEGLLRYEDLVDAGPPLERPPHHDENALAALCYTSGTTGMPKGVGYSHRALYLHTFVACLADGHAISERDTVLHVVPMFHANAWGIPFAAMMAGAGQVLPGSHPTPRDIARIIEAEAVTYVGMVPTVAVDLLRHVAETGADLSSLRALVLGGSPPGLDLIRSLEDTLRVPVFQGWGMTETAPMATFSRPPKSADADPGRRREYIRKQGRLLPGLRWRLVDEDGRDVPHDGTHRGELVVRGPWVATSYFREDRPECFLDGWLRTGDVATIDADGYLEVVDRTKDLIKSGGEWISSVALEEALMADPAVVEAAVVAVAHERWQERPLAFVVLTEDRHHAQPEELVASVRDRVPRWWVPDRVVVVKSLPRTSVGKIDKKRLRESLPTR